ncbi:MAG: hypothetical protein ACOZF0_11425 [Thermodesulfobacteriota bacterium]
MLFKDLLISVTSFFRDPEAFMTLENFFRSMVEQRDVEKNIRIWAPGAPPARRSIRLPSPWPRSWRIISVAIKSRFSPRISRPPLLPWPAKVPTRKRGPLAWPSASWGSFLSRPDELQSTNEELQATSEKLQAANEELITMNEAMEVKTSELAKASAALPRISAWGWPWSTALSSASTIRPDYYGFQHDQN